MNADAVAWLHHQLGDEIRFVGVSGYADGDEVAEVASRVRIDVFPQVHDPDGRVLDHYAVTSHPSLVLVGADGATERVSGTFDPMDMRARLEQLVAS